MNPLMKLARDEGQKGANNNEGGPFGAVIVDENENIISIGHNQVLSSNDPTAHAEVTAIRAAAERLKTHDLSGLTLYTSCEPCPMCLSAIVWSNIKNVYYACDRKDAASIGFRDDMIYNYLEGKEKDLLNMTQIDRQECKDVFEEYKENQKEMY